MKLRASLRHHRTVIAAALVLLSLAGVSVLAPAIVPYDPLHAVSGESLRPPSISHPLGTDLLGRDLWSRVLTGGGRTLAIGALALLTAALPGALIGLTAGYAGGWFDRVVGVVLDALLAFPALLLALTVIAVAGNGLAQVALAVGLAGFPSYARLARASAREVRARPYIEAARSLGARPIHILRVHILPGTAPTLLAFAAVTFSWAILDGSALAFLGFTGDRAAPDWGSMLADGRVVFRVSPWGALVPGVLIMLTVLAANRLADALSE